MKKISIVLKIFTGASFNYELNDFINYSKYNNNALSMIDFIVNNSGSISHSIGNNNNNTNTNTNVFYRRNSNKISITKKDLIKNLNSLFDDFDLIEAIIKNIFPSSSSNSNSSSNANVFGHIQKNLIIHHLKWIYVMFRTI